MKESVKAKGQEGGDGTEADHRKWGASELICQLNEEPHVDQRFGIGQSLDGTNGCDLRKVITKEGN